MVYKQAETAETCSINNSNQNPFVFPPYMELRIRKCARFFITECDTFIAKCGSYYKMQTFIVKCYVHNATFITNCVDTYKNIISSPMIYYSEKSRSISFVNYV